MGMLTLLPLLASLTGKPVVPGGLEKCQSEQSPTLRLACYDALARFRHAPAQPSAQQQARDSGFQMTTNPAQGDRILIRTLPSVGIITVSCQSGITRLSVRPATPWLGDTVKADVDGEPASGNWFVREQGQLLEFARGLPAIDELRHWFGHQLLTLSNTQGQSLRLPLDGLESAIRPLRQQCRWGGPS